MTSSPRRWPRRHVLAGLLPAACWTGSVIAAESSSGNGAPPLPIVHGDGRDDRTGALQEAVSRGKGGVLLRGTIRLTRPVTIDLDRVGPCSVFGDGTARILMAGPGPAFRVVGTHEGTASPHTVQANIWERQRMPCFDGFSIDGLHEGADGIEAVKTFGMVLSRLHIRRCRHAVHLMERNRNVIVEACHLYHNRGVGIYYDHVDLHQSNIGDCHISYNGGGGIVSRGGNVRNIHIGNCDLEGNHPPEDAPPSAATANILIDCRDSDYGTAEVAITGCTIQHTHRSPDSANIRILGGSRRFHEGHVTITGNVFSDVQTNVHFRGVRGATLTGNTFWQAFTHNLLIEDSEEIAISANNLNRNPRYVRASLGAMLHDVVIRGSRDITVSGMVLRGVRNKEGGFQLEDCRRITIQGCTLGDCDGPPLRLAKCDGVTVTGCLVGDADRTEATAIHCIDCGRIEMMGNIVYGEVKSV